MIGQNAGLQPLLPSLKLHFISFLRAAKSMIQACLMAGDETFSTSSHPTTTSPPPVTTPAAPITKNDGEPHSYSRSFVVSDDKITFALYIYIYTTVERRAHV